MTSNVFNEQVYLNHKEKNYSVKLPSALLIEFRSDEDAREFSKAIWTLLSSTGIPPMRSSLVHMEASEIYTKNIV